jgi:tetratricopeptide (TPR) repeat protein
MSISTRPWAVTLAVLVPFAVLVRDTQARNGEYASALTMARTILARWPSPNAQFMVGEELAKAGQHAEALAHLREAARTLPPARYDFALELVVTGQPEEAIEPLLAFIRDEPRNLATRSARFLLARAFEAKGQWPQAIQQVQAVLSMTPSDPDAHGLWADALSGQQAFAEAIPHYRLFLVGHPQDANAWTGLGVALVATGQGAAAIAAFRAAVAADPAISHRRQNLARALLDHGDLIDAAQEAQRAVSADPRDPAPREILGRVWAALGRFDDAQREFERSLQLDPSYVPARQGLQSLPVKRLARKQHRAGEVA